MELLSEVGNVVSSIFLSLWNFLVSIGNVIKNFFLKFVNIVQFFKNPSRLNKIINNKQALAVSIKDNLSNGRFNVINCLYDRSTEQVLEAETQAAGYENASMDNDLSNKFGNKDMLIIE